jgi:hypothetical protein
MFSSGVVELLKQVVTSWEVIAVTLGFILYVFIVNYVARSYHRPRTAKKISFKPKKSKPAPAEEGINEAIPSSDSNDELGLEEA